MNMKMMLTINIIIVTVITVIVFVIIIFVLLLLLLYGNSTIHVLQHELNQLNLDSKFRALRRIMHSYYLIKDLGC